MSSVLTSVVVVMLATMVVFYKSVDYYKILVICGLSYLIGLGTSVNLSMDRIDQAYKKGQVDMARDMIAIIAEISEEAENDAAQKK